MQIGDRIRDLREALDLKQTDVANALHINNKMISNYERNICYPTPENIIALSKFFGVTTDYLLLQSDEKVPGKFSIRNLSDVDRRILTYYHRLNEENRDCVRGLMVAFYKEQEKDEKGLP